MRTHGWAAAAVAALGVATTVLVAYLLATWPPPPPAASLPSVATSAPAAQSPTSDGEKLMVVLGDSFSSGTPANEGPEWPERLAQRTGWEVGAVALPETGFLAGRRERFINRVDEVAALEPDVVLVAGGISDVGAYPVDEIVAAAEEVLAELSAEAPRARVVLLSPFSDGPPGPLTSRVAEGFRRAAQAAGATYIDVTGFLPERPPLIGADGVHPTDRGHRRIARQMEDALRRLGVVDGSAAGI